METRRELLAGREWDLFRGPLRPEGDTSLPTEPTPHGSRACPREPEVQLGFEDPWLDEPEVAAAMPA